MSDASMSQLLDTMPALTDKLAVTLSSRLNSAHEQIRVQKESQGFFNELLGFITGSTARRQQQVNAHLAESVEQVVDQLNAVTEHVALGHRAIVRVKQDITTLDRYTGQLAEAVLAQREQLQQLAARMDEQLNQLDARLSHEEHYRQARAQLRLLIKRWENGLLQMLSPGQRCFVTLQNLYWGAFGHYVLSYPGDVADNLLEELILDCRRLMSQELNASPSERVARERWFTVIESDTDIDSTQTQAALTFLASSNGDANAPYSRAVTVADADTDELAFPHWCSGERLLSELLREVNLAPEHTL